MVAIDGDGEYDDVLELELQHRIRALPFLVLLFIEFIDGGSGTEQGIRIECCSRRRGCRKVVSNNDIVLELREEGETVVVLIFSCSTSPGALYNADC